MKLNRNEFQENINGSRTDLYYLSNDHIMCWFTNYGARIVALYVKDKNGALRDVVLGFKDIGGYLNADEQYHGATVGRYANRIADGRFILNGITYQLDQNSGNNHLHGGNIGYHNKVWNLHSRNDNSLCFELFEPDNEGGFPGAVNVQVYYTLNENSLGISFQAVSNKDTVLNMTHHSYFNLNGEGSGSILNHHLQINASQFLSIDEDFIPFTKTLVREKEAFNFSTFKKIGESIHFEDHQLKVAQGYDHNYCLDFWKPGYQCHAATAIGDQSGIRMEIFTDYPGLQFYSANHLSGFDVGKSGNKYNSREAFCLEPQFFPDSPNQKHFPSTVLRANDKFSKKITLFFKS